MSTQKTTYNRQTVSVVVRYECHCGHRFTRTNSDWFTINPFNTKSPEELRKQRYKEQSELKRDCPKCQKKCKPVTP